MLFPVSRHSFRLVKQVRMYFENTFNSFGSLDDMMD